MSFRKVSRSVFGWAMYDFANSAYTTSILAVIFSVYFVKVVIPPEGVRLGAWLIDGTSLWGFLNSAVMAVTILLSPTLGAWADKTGAKARSLMLWAVIGSLCTMGFLGVRPGTVRLGVLLTFAATLCYEMSLVFYNAFLKDISTDQDAGFVSGLGFALGYIGGGVALALNMLMIARPGLFGLDGGDPTLPYRAGFFVVGLWWLLFSIPTFLWVKDKPFDSPAFGELAPLDSAPFAHAQGRRDRQGKALRWTFILHTISHLKESIRTLIEIKNAFRFLVAYVIYNDGIQTILLMAAIFGAQALGMTPVQLGLCYLMIQFVAFIGAMISGPLADLWGHKNVVLLTLVTYIVIAIRGVLIKSQFEFWILGFMIGLILGGSQAASRSLFSLMIPESKSGELFALFSIVGKASSLLGPLIFGLVNQAWGIRPAVGSLLVFFVGGGLLLLRVQEPHPIPLADNIR